MKCVSLHELLLLLLQLAVDFVKLSDFFLCRSDRVLEGGDLRLASLQLGVELVIVTA